LPTPVVFATTNSGISANVPITWTTSDSFNAQGKSYTVTGILGASTNVDLTGLTTPSTTIIVTPTMAVNPIFSDTLVVTNNDNSALATDLGNVVLPISGNITVEGESIAYTIVWDAQTLDRTSICTDATFKGAISYPGAPAWLTLPSTLTVNRKVTVTSKTGVAITGITTPSKVYDGAVYVPTGTVSSGAVSINDLVWLWESTDGSGYSSATAPTNAGDYKLTLSVSDSNPTYAGSTFSTFSITKRSITLIADDQSITEGDNLPTLTYRVQNLAPGESKDNAIDTEPTLYCPTFDSSIVANYLITITGGTATGNYSIETRTNGMLDNVSAFPYGIMVCNVAVTDANKDNITGIGISGSVSYDPATKTLTLKNAQLAQENLLFYQAVYAMDDLTINLIGDNIMGKPVIDQSNELDYTIYAGVFSEKNVMLIGSGNLTIYDIEVGIGAFGNIVVDINGMLTVIEHGGKFGKACCLKAEGLLTVLRGNLKLSSYQTNAMYGGAITIHGGRIEAQTYGSGIPTYTFNTAPSFDSSNEYTVYAGASPETAVLVVAPEDATFTTSKYVRIEAGSNNNGGSSSSNSGGSGNIYVPAITTPKQPNLPKTTTVNGVVTDNSLVSNITKTMVQDALDKAGQGAEDIALIFKILGSNVTGQRILFDADAIDLLVASKVKYVQVETSIFKFSFDTLALAEIDKQTTGAVTVGVVPDSTSNGDRPAYDITIKDSTGKFITNLGKGEMMRGIAYTPTASEKTGDLYICKLVNGKWENISNSSYNDGFVIWSGNTCSVYGVAYQVPTLAFTDINGHWVAEHINFVVSRGIMAGVSETIFAPNTFITRGMFITMLGRVSEADVSNYTTGSFTDVSADSYYAPYIEWAVENKIVSGTGDNKFLPESTITREDMAVMIINYAKALNYNLPVALAEFSFTDANSISSYAKDAVTDVQQAGIIVGKDGGIFDPKGNLTRAEAATVVRRLVELVID